MSSYVEVMAIVEGKTEQIFIEQLLASYLGNKGISIRATQVSKPGQKGGDVTFERIERDVIKHLKQRQDTIVTTFIDFYGLRKWPKLDKITSNDNPNEISNKLNDAAFEQLKINNPELSVDKRFIPFMAIHEFEALLFSDPDILSEEIDVEKEKIETLLKKFGSPEAINNNPNTAPSKILYILSGRKFTKTIDGISIVKRIGIEKLREKCNLFNHWLENLETYNR